MTLSLRKKFCLEAFLLLQVLAFNSTAQVSIKGPTCVTTSVSYQYNITGSWLNNTNFKICVTGGSFVGSNSACVNGKPLSYVRINWDPKSTSGQLTLTSTTGDTTLNVSIITDLNGGFIDSAFLLQNVQTGKNPSTITCSGASGGNCSPVYSYQWQQSYDMMEWQDVPGATNQALSFSTPASAIIYYRRKVTETKSGAIAFSTTATIANN